MNEKPTNKLADPNRDPDKIRRQLEERRQRLLSAGRITPDTPTVQAQPTQSEQSTKPTQTETPLPNPSRKLEPDQPLSSKKPKKSKALSRRDFLKLAGATTLGAATGATSVMLEQQGISGWLRNTLGKLFKTRNPQIPSTETATSTLQPTESPSPRRTQQSDETKQPTNEPTETSEPTQEQTQTEEPTKEVNREQDPVYEYQDAFGQPVNYRREGVYPPTLLEIQGVTDPLDRPILLGFTPNNQDWNPDQRAIQESINNAEKGAAIIHFYQDWGENPQGSQFQPEWMKRIRDQGSIPFVTWMPGDARFWWQKDHPDFQKFALKNIAEGDFDDYIHQWAESAKNWGHPFFLRFGHEMNGHDKWWPYPWLTGTNPDTDEQLNTPEEFVAAWRHVHDIFTEVGANNVTWVWGPDAAGQNDIDFLQSLYPGDDYVHWVGPDIYEWGDEKPGDDFEENLKYIYNVLLEIAPQKPIMLPESGSQQDQGEKADWMPETFLKNLPWLFPQIQAVVYFNKNKRDEGRNWKFDTSEQSREAFAHAVSSQYYIGNQLGNISQSPIPTGKKLTK